MKSFQVAEFNAPLKEVEQPKPQPSGTQVLIKVKAAGVCHSDLHIWEGGYDLGHGRKPLSLKDRGVSLPRTMGHETVGEILAFGPDVIAGRAEAAGASHRMAGATRTAPKSAAAAFRNLDGQIGADSDRRRQDGRAGCRRKAECQCSTENNCPYHRRFLFS